MVMNSVQLPTSTAVATSTDWMRLLETNTTNTTTNSTATIVLKDAQVLKATFLVYGCIFLVLMILFCFFRRRYPKAYTVRNWADDFKTKMACEQHGFISWIYKVLSVSEEEMVEDCSVDSVCFLRIMRFGMRISLCGMFTAIWLLPLYGTAPSSTETDYIHDRAVQVTIAHVSSGSNILIATALSSYILFIFVMWSILQEIEWFEKKRHQFLQRAQARNYTVFLRNIPMEYRTNAALEAFFRRIYSPSDVVSASLRVNVPQLAKLVQMRDKVVAQLENALAVKQIRGIEPMHRPSMIPRKPLVPSIPTYSAELAELNDTIKDRLGDYEAQCDRERETSSQRQPETERVDESKQSLLGAPDDRKEYGTGERSSVDASATRSLHKGVVEVQGDAGTSTWTRFDDDVFTPDNSPTKKDVLAIEEDMHTKGGKHQSLPSGAVAETDGVVATKTHHHKGAIGRAAATRISAATAHLLTSEEGKMHGAGFVVFSKLSIVHATLQMVQSRAPFRMEVLEAPDCDNIVWKNVGREHKSLMVGKLISLALTTAICLLWTIPIAFAASLSSVAALEQAVPFIGTLIQKAPFLEPVIQLLAPLLVTVVDALLPLILTQLCLLEGPVSGAIIQASLFAKIAAFKIIQVSLYLRN
jgi:hypothetical protein